MSRSPDWVNSLGERREGQRLSHRLRAVASRRGVTLLELIIVLALLGLMLAIAAPLFTWPAENIPLSTLKSARRQAVLRGQPVIATVYGTRVHVTPLGVCIPEASPNATRATWDAIGCTASGEPAEAAPR